MQNMITGTVGSIACGVKFKSVLRCPCWKTQTRRPKEAEIESRLVSTALSGRITDPTSRKSTR